MIERGNRAQEGTVVYRSGNGNKGSFPVPAGKLQDARDALRSFANEADAAVLRRFFKTGPGEYGEGDRFLGVRVPATRRVARAFRHLPLAEVLRLLRSGFHEERLLALILLTHQYRKGAPDVRARIYRAYLANTRWINNWDLIDVSADPIVGAHLAKRSRKPLYALARSPSLWERRIAILSTFHFIRNRDFDDTLAIAAALLSDPHDLIHKAVGWMLREVGKRDRKREDAFLVRYGRILPRTTLRYAIEKHPERLRRRYLKMGRGEPGGEG